VYTTAKGGYNASIHVNISHILRQMFGRKKEKRKKGDSQKKKMSM
jgi:hypothetical protein